VLQKAFTWLQGLRGMQSFRDGGGGSRSQGMQSAVHGTSSTKRCRLPSQVPEMFVVLQARHTGSASWRHALGARYRRSVVYDRHILVDPTLLGPRAGIAMPLAPEPTTDELNMPCRPARMCRIATQMAQATCYFPSEQSVTVCVRLPVNRRTTWVLQETRIIPCSGKVDRHYRLPLSLAVSQKLHKRPRALSMNVSLDTTDTTDLIA